MVLAQTFKDFYRDSAADWAAAVAYYGLLSIFPLLLAAVSIAGWFVESGAVIRQLSRLVGEYIPQAASLERAVTAAAEAPRAVNISSIVVLLWAGSRVFGSLTKALNIAYGVEETYCFWKQRLVEMSILLTVGAIFVLSLTWGLLAGPIRHALGATLPENGMMVTVAQDVPPRILLFGALFLLYRFVPRTGVSWRAALCGAVVSTLLLSVARLLFIGYMRRSDEYDVVYGSVAVVVVLILWAWIAALITLFGGELTAHIQQMLIERRDTAAIAQRHEAHLSPGKALAMERVLQDAERAEDARSA